MRRPSLSRIAATLLLAVGVVTCTDTPTAPHGKGPAQIRLAPRFTADAERAFNVLPAIGLPINNVRVVLQRQQPPGTLIDTTIAWNGSDSLIVALNVSLNATSEDLLADVQIRAADGTILFEGTSTVTATLGLSTPAPANLITLSYVGPGATAKTLTVAPADTTMVLGQAFQLRATALDVNGQPVANLPIVWASSAGGVAAVDPTGVVSALSVGTTTITATAQSGLLATATVHVVNPPAKLVLVSGDGQSGVVGQTLPQPFVVQVLAGDGSPLQGISVAFNAPTGGGVTPTTVVTDGSGKASTTGKLGVTPGTETFGATVATLSATIKATAVVGPPAALALVSGNSQSDSVGTMLAQSLVVKATDSFGNAVAGANVSWSASAGTPSAASTTTDATGQTSIHFTLGPAAGIDTVRAQLAAASGAGTLVTFLETARSRGPSALVVISGSGQNAVAGSALAQPFVVEARDAKGNTLSGLTINWKVSFGTGSLSATQTTTDSTGRSSVKFTTGTKAGLDSVTATIANTTVSAAFGATGVAGPAALLIKVAGDGQTATVGTAVAIAPAVKVTDVNGNPVIGKLVTFTVVAGGGSATQTTPTTDALGQAAVGSWTLGATAGTNTLGVVVDNIGTQFTATASAVGVAAPRVATLTVSPHTDTLPGVATTFSFTSSSKDATGAVVTDTVTWTSRNPSIVSIGVTNGVATAVALGSTYVVGSDASGKKDSAFVAVVSRVASITISPRADTLTSINDTFGFTAQSKNGAGTVVADTLSWVSRAPGVVTVNGAGTVTAVANGSTYVVASDASGLKDSVVVVVQQKVASVTVTPTNRNIYLTRTFTFTASAVDGRNNPIGGSPTFTWSSVTPSIASVSSSGVVTANGLGSTQISATTGGITGVASVNVLTPITRIVVGRDSSGVPVTDTTSLTALGATRTFIAVAHDTLDAVMTGVTFTWASTNLSVAGLDSITATTARATASANGITSIQATAQGVTGSASLNVAQQLTAIQLSPASAAVAPSGTIALQARGVDANGHFIPGGTFTYTSSNTGVSTVNASTGVVTGVAIGTDSITATSGKITSNVSVITVSNSVPARISFGRDTLAVGRGGQASVPVLLSAPSSAPVTVNLAVKDTFAFFNPTSITIPAGATSANATLFGHNAGTTLAYARDGSNTGYAPDSSVLLVQANIKFATSGWSLNATDQVASQVLLSDPSPAGGTYVTYTYGTANVANVSPDPAFIPAGQLAANVVVKGLAAGTTTVTPTATGVNGTASSVTVYAPNLTFSSTSFLLGQGQYEGGAYVYVPTYSNTSIPLTLTSSDSTIVSVPSSVTIPAGYNYALFTSAAKGIGTARITVSSPGWTAANSLTVTSTTPHVNVCCGTTYNTTTPTQNFTVYSEDSVKTAHNRMNSLVVHVRSSDSTVLKVIDTTVTIAPGLYYNNSGRIIPGGLGGTAYLVVSAGGHTSDSTLYTVVGPKLAFSSRSGNFLGVGQDNSSYYVSTPNAVTSPLTVTITNTDSTKVALPPTVTVLNGSNYVYMDVRAKATGTVTLIASAPGYQSDTATYTATTPKVVIGGGGQMNEFGPSQGFTVYSTDSLRNAHNRTTALPVQFRSSDTTIVKVDTAATINAGLYYANTQQVTPVGVGSAKIYSTAAGHTGDSVTYTVVQPYIRFSTRSYRIGATQHRNPTDFYVYTPNTRMSNLAVRLAQKHPNVLQLTSTSLVVDSAFNYAYFSIAGLVPGVDTVITSASGYLPDTMIVVVTTPRLGGGSLPGTSTTTNPPFTVTVYAEDSVGSAHYASDTVAIHVVSTDTTVLKPVSSYMHVLKNNYWGQDTINIVGPGTAKLIYTDSIGYYVPDTSNVITVTGPSLAMSSSSIVLGMRQNTGANGMYVYAPNAVSAPLTVNLVSTATTVATVPASVTIPAGQNSAYFQITAQDTIGTIQIQATATGYNATSLTVQVTQPKFGFNVNTSARTTQGRQTINVYAEDANGTTHYTNENVTVTLASSATGVATIDSATVTIPAGSYYQNTANWYPVAVGTAQLTATDTRPAFYKYNTASATVSVTTPSLNFSWGSVQYLGLGQYIDNEYVATPDIMTSSVTVALSHTGTAHTTTVPASSVTINSGSNYANFRTVAGSVGTDSLVGTLTSPQHNPALGLTVVDSGRVDPLSGWPASLSLTTNDSTLITLYARDPQTSARNVLNATTFTLAPNANIQFVSGGASSSVITSVTIPAAAQYVQFYVKGVAAGTGSVTITGSGYKTYTNTLTVNP